MPDFIIQCTVCNVNFYDEKNFDSHPCLKNDVKASFKIKIEPQSDQEENELEDRTQVPPVKIKDEKLSDDEEMEVTLSSDLIDIKEEAEDYTNDQAEEEEADDPLGLSDRDDASNTSDQTFEIVDDADLLQVIEDEDIGVDGIIPKTVDIKDMNKIALNGIENVTDAVDVIPTDKKQCDVCKKRFYEYSDLVDHLKNSHKVPRPYQCKVCKKMFTQKHYVSLHMRVHTGEKPYKCTLCPRSYTHKTSFTIHMRIHNGERPYECGICGKRCYDKSGLTSHMRSHTKETPYQCDVCGRRFTHSKSLLVHRRNHTGEKPYSCRYCGKAFRHWHKHKIHIRLHTGERPYKCKICNKGFPRNDEVKRHMKSHQGIKSFKCSICGVYCATQASITGHIELFHSDLKEDDNVPNKTLIKDSSSGILEAKAHEPRVRDKTLYTKQPPSGLLRKALTSKGPPKGPSPRNDKETPPIGLVGLNKIIKSNINQSKTESKASNSKNVTKIVPTKSPLNVAGSSKPTALMVGGQLILLGNGAGNQSQALTLPVQPQLSAVDNKNSIPSTSTTAAVTSQNKGKANPLPGNQPVVLGGLPQSGQRLLLPQGSQQLLVTQNGANGKPIMLLQPQIAQSLLLMSGNGSNGQRLILIQPNNNMVNGNQPLIINPPINQPMDPKNISLNIKQEPDLDLPQEATSTDIPSDVTIKVENPVPETYDSDIRIKQEVDD